MSSSFYPLTTFPFHSKKATEVQYLVSSNLKKSNEEESDDEEDFDDSEEE